MDAKRNAQDCTKKIRFVDYVTLHRPKPVLQNRGWARVMQKASWWRRWIPRLRQILILREWKPTGAGLSPHYNSETTARKTSSAKWLRYWVRGGT
jgi:hypothetical protein